MVIFARPSLYSLIQTGVMAAAIEAMMATAIITSRRVKPLPRSGFSVIHGAALLFLSRKTQLQGAARRFAATLAKGMRCNKPKWGKQIPATPSLMSPREASFPEANSQALLVWGMPFQA